MLIILVCNVLKENYVKRGQKQKQTESDQNPLQALTLTTQAVHSQTAQRENMIVQRAARKFNPSPARRPRRNARRAASRGPG